MANIDPRVNSGVNGEGDGEGERNGTAEGMEEEGGKGSGGVGNLRKQIESPKRPLP